MDHRAWFEAYLAAFNGNDFEGFGAYYADDVQFFGQAATLVGRDAVLDFYRGIKSRVDERVDLLNFVGNDSLFAAEIRTTLVPRVDCPDFPTGPLMLGEKRQTIAFAMYDVDNRRFTRIRSARFRRLM